MCHVLKAVVDIVKLVDGPVYKHACEERWFDDILEMLADERKLREVAGSDIVAGHSWRASCFFLLCRISSCKRLRQRHP